MDLKQVKEKWNQRGSRGGIADCEGSMTLAKLHRKRIAALEEPPVQPRSGLNRQIVKALKEGPDLVFQERVREELDRPAAASSA